MFLPALAHAATHRVPSEYATIQAGIDACAEGDTVLIAPGTYTGEGNRDLQVTTSLTFLGAGRSATIIDCERQSRGITHSGVGGMLAGFTLRGGQAESGAGIKVYGSNGLTIQDVAVLRSVGTAISVGCEGGFVLRDALIAETDGGHGLNGANLGGGQFAFIVEDVTFARNRGGAAVHASWQGIQLRRSVIAYSAEAGLSGVEDWQWGWIGFVVAENCLFYENRGGNSTPGDDPVGASGNIAGRPFFCDALAGDYSLLAVSPCLPANNPMGLPLGGTAEGCDLPLHQVSGRVADPSGSPVPDVLIETGLALIQTDAEGSYVYEMPQGNSATLLPARHHVDAFAPASNAVSDIQADLPGQDFVATLRDSTVHVPAEAPDLQAALGLALAGDTIQLAPGIYTGAENLDLELPVSNLTLRGASAAETILDGEHALPGLKLTDLEARIEDLTLRNCQYKALSLLWGSRLELRDVHVLGASDHGIYIYGGQLTARDVLIAGCGDATDRGGGIDAFPYTDVYDNYYQPSFDLERCTIVHCAGAEGSAIRSNRAYPVPRLHACLLAFNGPGPALTLVYSHGADPIDASCSLFWGHPGGHHEFEYSHPDLVGADGNFEADPQFCGIPDSGNYWLQSDSPCLPAHNDCGLLIGALGQGCDETPVLLSSFTATPSPGAVYLTWVAEGGADFRLAATRIGTSWSVPWQAMGPSTYSAHDTSPALAAGGEVTYRLEGRFPGEDWQLLRALTVEVPSAFTTRLLAPHPNPFNPRVTIPFTLAAPGRARVDVFDLAGRRIARLADAEYEAGRHEIVWDAEDLPSGVYFARLSVPGYTESKRLVLLR